MLTLLVSCGEDTTADISRITYFPDFEISNGAQTDYVELGSAYESPTATATEGGAEIPSESAVAGLYTGATTFDVNVSDVYIFSWTAINSDGYPGGATKEVVVFETGDMVNSIAGLYEFASDRVAPAGYEETHTGMTYAMVREIAPGVFDLSHGIGGFYSNGRLYGPAYRFGGMQVQLDGGVYTQVGDAIAVGPWAGNGPAYVVDGTFAVDAASKMISYSTDWIGYIFDVTYTQVQP